MGDDDSPLAILPRSMGQEKPGAKAKAKADKTRYIPEERGGLLTQNPNEEVNPYSFSDSPAYTRQKEAEQRAKRAAELEQKDETRGFLKDVEELAKKQKWAEAFQLMERRTAVPSGLFLVTRAVLRWKFGKYCGSLRDADDALKNYGSSAKAGPLAAAFSSFARICAGSEPRDKSSCDKEMRDLVAGWEEAETRALLKHAFGQGLFHPRTEERLSEPREVVEGMLATDGTYVAASGIRIGYVLLKNQKDENAPFIIHFHGTSETAADYRGEKLAQKYRGLNVNLLVVDYRGYGWSGGEPSLATFLRDTEPLAEKLPEIFIEHGFAWPYAGGIIISGRSLGAQAAVHLAAFFPSLFRALVLDSAVATSATGDRLGRAPERAAALECWDKLLEKASLGVLKPLDAEMWGLSALEKIRHFEGHLLVLHGLADETVPYEGSESLHTTAATHKKELVLIEGAAHNNIGHFDQYWSAQRRLALKIQLDDSLPSVGPTVEHLCAVCAAKAVSKCGRCMKVWYCGRQHQSEHWKTHKVTCAGGPPEPKPKVDPEAEACIVIAVVANVCAEGDITSLGGCLGSLATQEQPPEAVYLSWYASSQDLIDKTKQLLDEMRSSFPSFEVKAFASATSLQQFEHIKVVTPAMARESPPHAWVAFVEPQGLWSPTCAATLLPCLRRAAADQRVTAVTCTRRARQKPTDGSIEIAPAESIIGVAEVEASLKSGAADLADKGAEPSLADFVVRIKSLQTFVESTPAPALSDELCLHRFQHKLQHTFGKKVQSFNPPEGEWMRWDPALSASSSNVTEQDRAQGAALCQGMSSEKATAATADGADAGGDAAPEAEPPKTSLFASTEEAAQAVSRFRQDIERNLILYAGDKMTVKDLRAIEKEHIGVFVKKAGLAEVIGIQRWGKGAAAVISEAAAHRFNVEITT